MVLLQLWARNARSTFLIGTYLALIGLSACSKNSEDMSTAGVVEDTDPWNLADSDTEENTEVSSTTTGGSSSSGSGSGSGSGNTTIPGSTSTGSNGDVLVNAPGTSSNAQDSLQDIINSVEQVMESVAPPPGTINPNPPTGPLPMPTIISSTGVVLVGQLAPNLPIRQVSVKAGSPYTVSFYPNGVPDRADQCLYIYQDEKSSGALMYSGQILTKSATAVQGSAQVHCGFCLRPNPSAWSQACLVVNGEAASSPVTPPVTPAVTTKIIRCQSKVRQVSCSVHGNAASARLYQQYSKKKCVEGRTWKLFANRIYVRRGCKGDFEVKMK